MFTASMTFDLGEEVGALREMVHRWAQERLRPQAAEIDRVNDMPRDLWREMGEPRASGDHRRGRVRRRGDGISCPCRGGRGDRPRLGLGQPVLRRAFEPLRQPDPPQRHRRAEAPVSAQAGLGRTCRCAGDVRGGGGIGRGVDETARRAAQRPLPAERHESTGSPTGRMPTRLSSMPRPIPRPDRRASPRSLSRKRWPASRAARISTSWGCGGRTRPS